MPASAAEAAQETESGNARQPGFGYIRLSLLLLGFLFAVCVAIQVFLAGMALFVNPSHWKAHSTFIHYFEMLPVGMFILTYFGRVRGAVRWFSLVMTALIALQYATVHMSQVAPIFSALHPVFALLLFWTSVVTVKRAYAVWRS
ncbi:hypothetical protein KZ483_26670 [Paenibacillus sp. sptzw28]|uniref:DUF6220 domain-containing protein n=1 Tax=Paenibacillus sp. sptzw28 TaxID=715179 RepID=UPI001C6EAE7E|nr:DUF6220 domain-containing protein [Paenibacillus sp. sptzw28]QYR21229.1 hypothetical protein KZ483_26670 [Paenibacillus sp. sptzw28]